MDNQELAKILEKRTRMFARIIFQLSAKLENSAEEQMIRKQISLSASSIGIHYRQSNLAKKEEDFVDSIIAAEAATSETLFWLELVQDMGWFTTEGLEPILKEVQELLAIFTSLYVNTKNKK